MTLTPFEFAFLAALDAGVCPRIIDTVLSKLWDAGFLCEADTAWGFDITDSGRQALKENETK